MPSAPSAGAQLSTLLAHASPVFLHRNGVDGRRSAQTGDLAPTVLKLLGVGGGETMHGRVLREALTDGDSVTWQTQTYRAELPVSGGTYRQYITVYRVESTTYVDEGNGIIEVE